MSGGGGGTPSLIEIGMVFIFFLDLKRGINFINFGRIQGILSFL